MRVSALWRVVCTSMLVGGIGACNKAGDNVASKAGKTPATTSSKSSTVASLSFDSLTPTTIYTSDGGINNCSTFKVKGTDSAGAAVSGATVDMTISGVTDITSVGQLSTPLVTDSDGAVTGTFCAASKETKVILIATSGTVTANSGSILVSKKPTYVLTYRNSDFDTNSVKPKELLNLNLLDSGPNDCGNIYFQLKKVDTPISGISIKFMSDFGYPAGSKLRVRTSTDTPYEADSVTQKNFLSYTATSDADGVFKVPVCAGQLPGSFIVFANYTDPDSKPLYVKSPTISVSSGVANLIDIGITYDTTNAKVLKALFNNEVPTPLEFIARLSSVFGGALSVLNPLYVHSESGTLVVDNAGVPNNTGAVEFSMLASYNGSYRPTPVKYFQSSAAQATCDPVAIATEIGAGQVFKYSELVKNWRSTVVYMVRGQEPFHDANRNGKFDATGDGFRDVNQDGVYTQGIDYITWCSSCSPPILPSAPLKESSTGATKFHSNGEWFIDLPTPFVDADENGKFEALDSNSNPMDRLIGDIYQDSNGKRDVDTLVWKNMFLPVYTGTSPYAMVRSTIKGGTAITSVGSPAIEETQDVSAYYLDLTSKNLGGGDSTKIFHALTDYDNTNAMYSGSGGYTFARYVHAQGICGSPAPGGTEIKVNPILIGERFGDRTVTAEFYSQPGDNILDPSRRMIVATSTGNTAKLNFNMADHASAAVSYPVLFYVDVPRCTRIPANGSGAWCDAIYYDIAVTMDGQTITSELYIPEYIAPALAGNPCQVAGFTRADYSTGSCVAP